MSSYCSCCSTAAATTAATALATARAARAATAHRHRPAKAQTTTACFGICVRPDRCNPAAHGWMVKYETCRCGATRATNDNGNHCEVGRWSGEND